MKSKLTKELMKNGYEVSYREDKPRLKIDYVK